MRTTEIMTQNGMKGPSLLQLRDQKPIAYYLACAERTFGERSWYVWVGGHQDTIGHTNVSMESLSRAYHPTIRPYARWQGAHWKLQTQGTVTSDIRPFGPNHSECETAWEPTSAVRDATPAAKEGLQATALVAVLLRSRSGGQRAQHCSREQLLAAISALGVNW